jgi:RNA polymerase sigma-70 factor (ECF subfamily)
MRTQPLTVQPSNQDAAVPDAPHLRSLPSFDQIYAQYGERILNLLFRYVNNEPASRDILQDVFLKVYQNLDSFRKESDIGTWIHRIAVNEAINFLRREKRTFWFNLLDEPVAELLHKQRIDLPSWGIPHSATPHATLEAQEQSELINAAIAALPVKYRIPFLLQRDEEMNNTEIANVLSLSISAVETRIHRAKKMLVERLRPLLNPDS